MDESLKNKSSVSFIIEHDIFPDKISEFLQWQSEINSMARQFKGYLKTENFSPIKGVRDKWYTVIYFDTPENLTCWLESDARHHSIKTKRHDLGFYRFIGYKTGFEEWLSLKKSLPRWKQALSVLIGLYPTIMIQNIIFSHWPIMESLPLAPRILVNNIINCSILTWIVMPLVTKLFSFWLSPKEPSLQINWIGLLLISMGLGMMVSLFTALT